MLRPSDIYDRVVAQLRTCDGWAQSKHPAEYLRDHVDAADVVSRVWAVSVPTTTPLASRQGRTPGSAMHAQSSIVVGWLYRLRVEAISDDYARALAAEDVLRIAALGVGASPELSVRLDEGREIERLVLQPASGPLVYGTLRFLATHQIRTSDPA